MAAKKDPTGTLPLTIENEDTPSASITYANEVVAIIAGLAANEVEGIAGMCNVSGSILNKNRNVTKGVKVEIGTEEVAVDLYVVVEYGTPIQRAAMDAQESVRKAIESMTGLHVVRVDVHVQSVSFEQENKILQAGAASAALEAGATAAEPDRQKEEEPKPADPEKAVSPEEKTADKVSAEEPEQKKAGPAAPARKKSSKNKKEPAPEPSVSADETGEEGK